MTSADLTVPPPMPPLDGLENYLSDKLRRHEDLMRHVPEMREPIELREWLAALASMRADNANLRTVMVAAAEEIHAHWDAHCDAEGYGPASLMRRLEEGIPAEYGYTAGTFASLQARLDAAERSRATLLDALAGAVTRCQRFGYVGQDGQYIKVMRAAIDAATQEKP
jgi:hypothetical protein